MSLLSTEDRFGPLARALHWGIAAAIVILLATGLVADDLPKEIKATVIPFHKALGMIALALGLIRIGWWAVDRNRPGDEPLRWEKWPARFTMWGLLALSLAVPVSGYLMSAYAGRPIMVLGVINIPLLVGPDIPFSKEIKEVHEMLANGLLGLLVLHFAGALYHHFVRRDGILRRMLPACGSCTKKPTGVTADTEAA